MSIIKILFQLFVCNNVVARSKVFIFCEVKYWIVCLNNYFKVYFLCLSLVVFLVTLTGSLMWDRCLVWLIFACFTIF
jgi:hypothetical protein